MRLPQTPPDQPFELSHDDIRQASTTDPEGRYLPWDELRRKTPTPHGWTHERWWRNTHFARLVAAEQVPEMSALYDEQVHYVLTDGIKRKLHNLDRNPSNRILLELVDDPESLSEYRVRELLEEAIDSSMIEGARPTTRDAARQMLQERRTPLTRDERMIVNNWQAMQHLLELREQETALDLAGILELHRILGEGALECARPAGEFREDEDVTVMDVEGVVWHRAPPRKGLENRVEAMLRFAQPLPDDRFVHPVIRAVIVHFWFAYEHPFCDGNGRMARALYYWVMLRNGYEIAEFLSISGAIRKRGNKYYRAFAYSEVERLDLTYFLLDQFASIDMALNNLIERLTERKKLLKATQESLAEFKELNHRQRALLETAVRHPLRSYTTKGHAAVHGVHYLTARTDLLDLAKRGLMSAHKVGRENQYKLADKLRKND